MGPSELVSMLNTLFCLWDSLVEEYNVEKVKTIGDWYMFYTTREINLEATWLLVVCQQPTAHILKIS